MVELRDLRLQHNQLRRIRKGVFYSLPNLQELDLQMNNIEMIENLESLANLQHINLQGNKLLTFHGKILSKYPSSLRYLQIGLNNLELLKNDTFRGQTELEVLWLQNNNLKKLSNGLFDDLINTEKLHLENNLITEIDDGTFSMMNSLMYLNLANNRLGQLGRGMFRGLNRLRELRLSGAEIIGIEPNTMEPLRALEIFDLSDNQIYTIRRSMFPSGSSIQELYLKNIMADDIETDAFDDLTMLRILDLSQNSINARRMNGVRLPGTIRSLNISGNNLSNKKGIELNSEFIEQLNENLEKLDLSATHFRISSNTKKFFSSLKHLTHLWLDGNEIDQIIYDISLPINNNNSSSLIMLSLSKNLLDTIPSMAISQYAPNLQSLFLSYNQIKKISSNSMISFKKLQNLDLSNNRISIIEPRAFDGLIQLIHLDLSGNVLRSISGDIFDRLPKLQHVSVAKNWLNNLPETLLQSRSTLIVDADHNPLTKLRDLNGTDYNNRMILPLERLNIRRGNLSTLTGNDFRRLDHLVSLSLTGNQIVHIDTSSLLPLKKLSYLDISENRIENLKFYHNNGKSLIDTLTVLNVSNNLLIELPIFTINQSELLVLDISFNRITKIESFGDLPGYNVQELSLRHNMISWIANNAFQNLTSLIRIDLRQNFLTQISDSIFESIEVRLQSIMLSGNPFHCDCRLLSIYQWLEEHSRLVKFDGDEEMICDQPDKLKHDSIQSLQPIDFCPIPMITLLEVNKIEPSLIRLRWEVQNETLVGGFTMEYYLTSERSLTSPAGLQLNSAARTAELRDLVSEKWYTVCVEANGKYLRTSPSPPVPETPASSSGDSGPPLAHYMMAPSSSPNGIDTVVSSKTMFQDFVTGNRKCSQIRTLSLMEGRKLMSLPAANLILAIGLFFILILCIGILMAMLFRMRKRRRRTGRRRSSVANSSGGIRSGTMISFGSVTTNSSSLANHQIKGTPIPSPDPGTMAMMITGGGDNDNDNDDDDDDEVTSVAAATTAAAAAATVGEMAEITVTDVDGVATGVILDDYVTYRHFALPSNIMEHHHHHHHPHHEHVLYS